MRTGSTVSGGQTYAPASPTAYKRNLEAAAARYDV
jgi:hypothetical protein